MARRLRKRLQCVERVVISVRLARAESRALTLTLCRTGRALTLSAKRFLQSARLEHGA